MDKSISHHRSEPWFLMIPPRKVSTMVFLLCCEKELATIHMDFAVEGFSSRCAESL